MATATQLAHLSPNGHRRNVEASSSESQASRGSAGSQEIDYDVGKFSETATYIKTVIYITLFIVAVCLAGSITILVIGEDRHRFHFGMSETTSEIILLCASFLVTICSDGLGYVHSTSLRWALYAERRLEYNTNLRFFKSATWTKHYANKWPMNLLCAASLLLSYASVSLLLVRSDYRKLCGADTGKGYYDESGAYYYDTSEDSDDLCDVNDFSANVIALAGLGFGLCGQLVTASLCLRHHEQRILSWNPNPLWNAFVIQRTDNEDLRIYRQAGRCMQSVFDNRDNGRHTSVTPKRPGQGKRRLWHLPSTKWNLLFVWLLCVVTFIWPVVVILITEDDFGEPFRFRWDRDMMEIPENRYRKGVYDWILNGSDYTDNDFPIGVQYLIGILFLCGIQMLLLLGLHCVELLVNLSRDEFVWRKASKGGGSNPAADGPLFAAVASWRTVFLTVLKALLHWMIGQCVVPEYWGEFVPDYDGGNQANDTVSLFSFVMSASRLILFGIVMLALAGFATTMAIWPIHGYQPVAWGHFETLVDLVDDWGLPGSTLYWGDKPWRNNRTTFDPVRHAGTVSQHELQKRLDPKGIRPNQEYGGPGCCPLSQA